MREGDDEGPSIEYQLKRNSFTFWPIGYPAIKNAFKCSPPSSGRKIVVVKFLRIKNIKWKMPKLFYTTNAAPLFIISCCCRSHSLAHRTWSPFYPPLHFFASFRPSGLPSSLLLLHSPSIQFAQWPVAAACNGGQSQIAFSTCSTCCQGQTWELIPSEWCPARVPFLLFNLPTARFRGHIQQLKGRPIRKESGVVYYLAINIESSQDIKTRNLILIVVLGKDMQNQHNNPLPSSLMCILDIPIIIGSEGIVMQSWSVRGGAAR